MIKNKVISLVNKDQKLRILFGGMVLDGIILIALIIFAGILFIL